MTGPIALRRRVPPVDRSADRSITLGAIVIAVGFLIAATLSASLPAADRLGAWLPLHLALAGGASTAIVGVMPFFTAALASAPPSAAWLRSVAVGSVSLGAAGMVLGVVRSADAVAAASGALYVIGILFAGLATVRPLRRALGSTRGLVTKGYLLALAFVAMGASTSTLFLAGWAPVVEAWAALRPAHAWLNLVGFVSLVIGTTLLHFFPTVVGARIAGLMTARVTVVGLAAGAVLVALGLALRSDPMVRAGAALSLVGSTALAAYAWRAWRTRAGWRTDPDWHRFAMGGLVSAIVWFELGMIIAAARLLVLGAVPASWAAEAVIGPLVVGWMGLAVVASATHLLPAIGPGGPIAHRRQRRVLGRASTLRLVAADAGIAALSMGLPLGLDLLVVVGFVLVGLGLGATGVLLGVAAYVGMHKSSKAAGDGG